jgi:hypothetical protein
MGLIGVAVVSHVVLFSAGLLGLLHSSLMLNHARGLADAIGWLTVTAYPNASRQCGKCVAQKVCGIGSCLSVDPFKGKV